MFENKEHLYYVVKHFVLCSRVHYLWVTLHRILR